MAERMQDEAGRRQKEAADLELEIAEVCGVMNAVTARLVHLIGRVLETESWQGYGIRSASHWVAWKCGVSPVRARRLVLMARRLGELTDTRAAFDEGALCEDQVAVVCRHAPATFDADAATLARWATVVQLRRVLGSYPFVDEATAEPTEPKEAGSAAEPRRMSFGPTERGSWQLYAELPADEGALVERALVAAPVLSGVDWADAMVAMADRSLGSAIPAHHDRSLVLLHIGTDRHGQTNGHLHLGGGLSEGLRRFVGCDARIRPVIEAGAKPVSVGRAFRTVPDRTRTVIEERDRGCRVPGCDRSRWLHVHHVRHWEDGGTSDTPNLIALCHRHHRLHHLGRLGIEGDAGEPDGIRFTDDRGRPLDAAGRPALPGRAFAVAAADLGIAAGAWSHPRGERLDPQWVYLNEAS